ncbi:MAG: hypothetical protein JST06_09045 [Bacteroidetes bacterium]|nr:hypothetical protein [Bacteroidota bacterium]MBS1629329.1 hypothetical protein [Bacteroidota bacterium]
MNQKNQSNITGISFPLKAYTVRQLADLYGVTTKTFRRWIAPFNEAIGDRHGHFYNIIQVKCIVQNLGVPGDVVVE